MKIRPGFIVLLALVTVFGVMKVLPRGGEGKGTGRSARSGDPLAEEGRRSSRGRKAARPLSPPLVDLAALESEAGGREFAVGRNLFRYGAPKAAAAPAGGPGGKPFPGRPGAQPAAPPPETNLTPPAPVQPSAPPKPRPPAVTVRYLGAFGPEGRMLAVFTDGAEIYDVFEGEAFADRYILRSINLETVELGFQGFPEDMIEKLEVGP